MRQIGLALSGGGFRATLFHLGMVRFLRDAGLLRSVSHITSVSGGSVLAAHLVLNWDRYCGSENEFNEAAKEIVRFIQLDVRNRVVRRYPLAALFNGARRMARLGASRRMTRPGLLESHYEKHLYGHRCLVELPEYPQLHILATNVGEGSLCSFTRRGIVFETRTSDDRQGFKLVPASLCTVPMAVAASSAFPGFFPPLELSAWDVGANDGDFARHSFTDGGVFDNLGIRMFRWIEQSWMREDNPLKVEDFVDAGAVMEAIRSAASSSNLAAEESPLRRIATLVTRGLPSPTHSADQPRPADDHKQLAESLWGLIENHKFYADPCFQEVCPKDLATESLWNLARTTGRPLDWGDHVTLNRQLLDAALQEVIGHSCLSGGNCGPEVVIVSDAGKKISSVAGGQSGGLIQTAIRSSEILMNRVWQLERETFEGTPGFVFASINDFVAPSEDSSAMQPEVQQQVPGIRTDLDRFDDLEIRSLVQHGYCVARKTLRSRVEFAGSDLPDGPPWDPRPENRSTPTSFIRGASEPVAMARALQRSSKRRIWSGMLSLGDWPTYIWAPVIFFLLFGGPYLFVAAQRTAQRNETVLAAASQAKQIGVRIASASGSLRADASFMSTLPPIQGIIDTRMGSVSDPTPANDREIESEEVWRERLETIFQGLLRSNPSYRFGVYVELKEDGAQEIVRVERYEKESPLVHTMPEKGLAFVGDKELLREAKQLRPGEVKVVCTEFNRAGEGNDGQEEARSRGKHILAAAAVHDQNDGALFGVVVLELDLESVLGELILPAAASVNAVYITDQEGLVLQSSGASVVAESPAPATNITSLVPQTTEFLTPTNRAQSLTDQRSFVAQKVRLDPHNPASVIVVVITFAT